MTRSQDVLTTPHAMMLPVVPSSSAASLTPATTTVSSSSVSGASASTGSTPNGAAATANGGGTGKGSKSTKGTSSQTQLGETGRENTGACVRPPVRMHVCMRSKGRPHPTLIYTIPPNQTNNQKTGRWTCEEHVLFLKGLEMHGKGWKKIAKLIKTRTVVQIRTHAQKYFQKLAKAKNGGHHGDLLGMEGGRFGKRVRAWTY